MLPTEELLEVLRSEGTDLARLAVDRLERPVPTCPGWRVAEVVGHTGSIHRWVTEVVATGGPVQQRDLPGAAVLDWYSEGLDRMVEVLGRDDPDREVWTFAVGSAPTVGWWVRRMALETALHRFDVETAGAGNARGLTAPLAADGIDEYLVDFFPSASAEDLVGLTGTLHLHATDTAGEWVVDLPARSTRREHTRADTAVRGPASDLLAWLWNRQPAAGHLEVLGDPGPVEHWPRIRF